MNPEEGKKWSRFLVLLLPVISCAAALAPVPLYAQACGDRLTVQGPGTITNFGIGIDADTIGELVVQNLTLTSGIGIRILQSGPFRIVNNTISGGGIGIAAAQTANGRIKGNTITGMNVGISMSNSGANTVIIQNSVSANGTGLSTHQNFPVFPNAPITLLGNDFSNNELDGVHIDSNIATIWLNTVNGNGRDGILLTGQLGTAGNNLIQDNVADNNGNRGIALENVQGNSHARVTDNEVLRNALDLFWDGTGGTDNCWKFNTFGTSDPATLPTCGFGVSVKDTGLGAGNGLGDALRGL